jgi:DNA helicase-2/ATP-dependent DNA helicase PcrA
MNFQFRNKDFAILYRTNAQSRSMEEALRKMGIAYRIYGGLSFYKRKEIKDLLAYFRLVINHDDEEAFKRIINVPARGIGKTTVEKLTVTGAENEKSLWQLIENPHMNPCAFNSGTLGRLNDFASMIRSFKVKLKVDNAFDLATTIATSTGLLRELYQDKTPEGLSRYENVQELLNGIKEFVETGRSITPAGDEGLNQDPDAIRTLDQYMQDIALLTDADDDDDQDNDKVSLMTIHSAKGLEFPAVFVVGLEENLFPSQMSMDTREDLEEERRLFYVAITRAEQKLFISYANSRYKWGNLINCEPSRFIEEIDPEFIEDTGPRQQKSNFVFDEMPFDRWDRPAPTNTLSHIQQKMNAPKNLKKVTQAAPSHFEAGDTAGIQVGMEVEHAKFGAGKVVLVEGNPGDLKATVFFEGFGNKQLLLRFAKLRILG